MAAVTLTVDSIADQTGSLGATIPQNTTVTLGTAAPWTVSGTATFQGPATMISAMGYQIDDGPVSGFPPPSNNVGAGSPAGYSVCLTTDDMPGNGQYLLTVYAWDDDNPQGFATFVVIIQVQVAATVNFPNMCGGGGGS